MTNAFKLSLVFVVSLFSVSSVLSADKSFRVGFNYGAFEGPTVAYEINEYFEIGSHARAFKRVSKYYSESASFTANFGASVNIPFECRNTKMSLRALGAYPGFRYYKDGGIEGYTRFQADFPLLNVSIMADPVEFIVGPVVSYDNAISGKIWDITLGNVQVRMHF